MCGLIGVASTEGMKNRSDRLQFMKMGLDIDSWRGWESTGMALIQPEAKESPLVYKRALNGRDFIQLNQVEKYLADIEKYSVVLGHNRAATTGRGNIVDHNAHPFQYGRITLVHNGHIRNTQDLKGATIGAGCQVDSAHVAWAMNELGEQETLETVDGGFVFVWWNSETNTLNIARNTERPLHMAFAAKENTFYWASELTALLHLLKDVEIDEEIGILYPKAWNWYQFELKNLREFKKIPFVKSQGRHSTQTDTHRTGPTGNSGHGWTDEELAEWESSAASGTNSTTTSTGLSSQTSGGTSNRDTDEIEEIRQRVANQRLKDAKASGVPTSKKRQTRAKAELRKLGIEYNSMRNCTPISWCKYKNQNNLGSVLARTKKGGLMVEVLQVKAEQFAEYTAHKNLLVDCVNVRNGPNNDVRVIGVVSGKMKKYLEHSKSSETLSAGVPDDESPTEGGSVARTCDGPDGVRISLAKFREYTSGGCANCQRAINSKHHGAIIWVGSPPMPVCPECGADPAILELLGIPQEYRQVKVH